MFSFSDSVNLLDSSPGTALHLRCDQVQVLMKENQISHLLLLTLPVMFRVGFSVDGMLFSNAIEHSLDISFRMCHETYKKLFPEMSPQACFLMSLVWFFINV